MMPGGVGGPRASLAFGHSRGPVWRIHVGDVRRRGPGLHVGLGENAEALMSVLMKGMGALAMLIGGLEALMWLVGLIPR